MTVVDILTSKTNEPQSLISPRTTLDKRFQLANSCQARVTLSHFATTSIANIARPYQVNKYFYNSKNYTTNGSQLDDSTAGPVIDVTPMSRPLPQSKLNVYISPRRLTLSTSAHLSDAPTSFLLSPQGARNGS